MSRGSISVQFVGRLFISLFIIGVVVILLATFLPDIFSGEFCGNRQFESIGNMVEEAASTRSTTIKAFNVENCVEYVDFGPVRCDSEDNRRFGSDIGDQRCYEVLKVGQAENNCEDFDSICSDDESCSTDAFCSGHKGTFKSLPGSYNAYEITYTTDTGEGLRFTPGKYLVEIGPYSIKFLSGSIESGANE